MWQPAVTIFLFSCLVASESIGQPTVDDPATNGFALTPSLELAQLFDTNLFFSPTAPVEAFYTRATPGLETSYKSPQIELAAGYNFSSELFQQQLSELDDALARQQATASMALRLNVRTTLSASGSFLKSRYPNELISDTGIEFGIQPSQGYRVGTALQRELTIHSRLTVAYAFQDNRTDRDLGDILSNQSHGLDLSWEYSLNPRTDLVLQYGLTLFAGDDAANLLGAADTTSHVVVVALGRQLTSHTRFVAEIGPRFTSTPFNTEAVPSEESVEASSLVPEISVALNYDGDVNSFGISYRRSQNQAIGLVRFVNTQSLTSVFDSAPGRFFELRATVGAFLNSRGSSGDLRSYHAGADLGFKLARWLTLRCALSANVQEGSIFDISGLPVESTGRIQRNAISVNVTLEKPFF